MALLLASRYETISELGAVNAGVPKRKKKPPSPEHQKIEIPNEWKGRQKTGRRAQVTHRLEFKKVRRIGLIHL